MAGETLQSHPVEEGAFLLEDPFLIEPENRAKIEPWVIALLEKIATWPTSTAIESSPQEAPLQCLMVEGPMGSGKTSALLAAAEYLLTHHPSDQTLILASNHHRKKTMADGLFYRLNTPLSQLPVYTFPGFVRNLLFHFWPLVEQRIESRLGPPPDNASLVFPVLSGLEESAMILDLLLHEGQNRGLQSEDGGGFYEGFPGTQLGLRRQLMRRLRLRSENRLSRQEMIRRSQRLGHPCLSETQWIEKRFDEVSYQLRVLDTNKQLDVFFGLIEDAPEVQQWLTRHIKFLIADDLDESTPALQRFLHTILPNCQGALLAYDPQGGSRRGYLNAYPDGIAAFHSLYVKGNDSLFKRTRQDELFQNSERLRLNWEKDISFSPLQGPSVAQCPNALTQVELLEQVYQDILQHLSRGGSPGDIAVVLPKKDPLLYLPLTYKLKNRGIPVQLVEGTQRPIDHPTCWAFMNALQVANPGQHFPPLSPLEMKSIFDHIFHLSERYPALVEQWLNEYGQYLSHEAAAQSQHHKPSLLPSYTQWFGVTDLEGLPSFPRQCLEALEAWIQNAPELNFGEQLYGVLHQLASPFLKDAPPVLKEWKRMIDSYQEGYRVFKGMIQSSGEVFGYEPGDADYIEKNYWATWFRQAKLGNIADAPEAPESFSDNALLMGTPQKIIDIELRRPLQLWLDTGSWEWCRTDTAPLYDAWAHSPYGDAHLEDMGQEGFQTAVQFLRAAHVTRTLMLLATRQVRFYFSELNAEGQSQKGPLFPRCQVSQHRQEETPLTTPSLSTTPPPGSLKRVLRADQERVLQYQKGTMAISAVPGSGKTFVNVELILKLMRNGMEGERILVLTYMDSAAKTLLSRVKKLLDDEKINERGLPTVCTIHSLAYRILMEHGEAAKMGIQQPEGEDSTLNILDDPGREKVLLALTQQFQPPEGFQGGPWEWAKALEKAIAQGKNLGFTPKTLGTMAAIRGLPIRLAEFIPIFEAYDNALQKMGAWDYADLILKAIEMLESHASIREKYQSLFQVIIEDEAQDSSLLLQRFIQLLGGKEPNLIRTGDTNQSITTTFSSADPKVFRHFIQEANVRVEMDASARCAPEVMTLANQFMDRMLQTPELAQAFLKLHMKPVQGLNPSLLFPIEAQSFPHQQDEIQWIIDKIKFTQEHYPQSTIAILTRTNDQVRYYAQHLQEHRIPALCHSEDLGQHPIFQFTTRLLRALVSPLRESARVQLYEALRQCRLFGSETHTKAQQGAIKQYLEAVSLFKQPPSQWPSFDPEGTLDPDGAIVNWMVQLHYDWQDFSRDLMTHDPVGLLIRITDRYFYTVHDRSNGYLCAIEAQELLRPLKTMGSMPGVSPMEWVVSQFEQMEGSNRRKKVFSMESFQHISSVSARFVQLMTLHKSKGQEFDVVFIPAMVARDFPSKPNEKRIQESDRLILGLQALPQMLNASNPAWSYQEAATRMNAMVRAAIEGYQTQTIEEVARLVYVGITRAKRGLFCSTFERLTNSFQRNEKASPSFAFQTLHNIIACQAGHGEDTLP